MRSILVALLVAAPLAAQDAYLFTSFRKNGQTGVYFALSRDGKTFAPLKNNEPWLKPEHEGMLMRDPHLTQGPDGVWHMVWTWGWRRTDKNMSNLLRMGHATSKDLIHWSAQQEIRLFENEPNALNVWAPESVWNSASKEWVIFFATTITGKFPETQNEGDNNYNHRIYAFTTKDWKTFTPPKLFFNPGYSAIDSTLIQDGKRWVMVFKDERKSPMQKRLRLAFADSPSGPFTSVTEPFTKDWIEGPTAVKIGADWWIYFDHYGKPQHVGAYRTRDWKNFEDMTSQLKFSGDHRHGTVVRIAEKTALALEAVKP